MRKNESLELFVGAASIVVTLAFAGLRVAGMSTDHLSVPFGSDLWVHRPMEGTVTKVGSRYVRGEHGGQEKIALTVDVDYANPLIRSVACTGDRCYVECHSTRCAAIEEGEVHRFECAHDWRLFEPSVVWCKHVEMVSSGKEQP